MRTLKYGNRKLPFLSTECVGEGATHAGLRSVEESTGQDCIMGKFPFSWWQISDSWVAVLSFPLSEISMEDLLVVWLAASIVPIPDWWNLRRIFRSQTKYKYSYDIYSTKVNLEPNCSRLWCVQLWWLCHLFDFHALTITCGILQQ